VGGGDDAGGTWLYWDFYNTEGDGGVRRAARDQAPISGIGFTQLITKYYA
jgi:hypothetical protein